MSTWCVSVCACVCMHMSMCVSIVWALCVRVYACECYVWALCVSVYACVCMCVSVVYEHCVWVCAGVCMYVCMFLHGDQRSMPGVFPSCFPPYIFETWSLTAVANLGCQFNWIWNPQQQIVSCLMFMIKLSEEGRHTLSLLSPIKEWERRKLAFACLSSFFLASLSISLLWHFFTTRSSFFGIPTQAEDQQLSRNPLGLQH